MEKNEGSSNPDIKKGNELPNQLIKLNMINILINFTTTCLILFFSQDAFAQKKQIPALKAGELVNLYQSAPGVMVVNFWSTWCKPCLEEIPHFIEVTGARKNEGVQLLLVSQDTKALYHSGTLEQFLHKKKWEGIPIVWLNETDADHYCPLIDSTWSGVIPATLIIHPTKNYYRFFEEGLSHERLNNEIEIALKGIKENGNEN